MLESVSLSLSTSSLVALSARSEGPSDAPPSQGPVSASQGDLELQGRSLERPEGERPAGRGCTEVSRGHSGFAGAGAGRETALHGLPDPTALWSLISMPQQVTPRGQGLARCPPPEEGARGAQLRGRSRVRSPTPDPRSCWHHSPNHQRRFRLVLKTLRGEPRGGLAGRARTLEGRCKAGRPGRAPCAFPVAAHPHLVLSTNHRLA